MILNIFILEIYSNEMRLNAILHLHDKKDKYTNYAVLEYIMDLDLVAL